MHILAYTPLSLPNVETLPPEWVCPETFFLEESPDSSLLSWQMIKGEAIRKLHLKSKEPVSFTSLFLKK